MAQKFAESIFPPTKRHMSSSFAASCRRPPWARFCVARCVKPEGAENPIHMMAANGANPKRENARVAAAMWGGTDSFEQSAHVAV